MEVCVTGATGFIAGHLIELLLKSGYNVRATVRNTQSDSAKQLLVLMESLVPNSNLKLYKADLLTFGSFNEAIKGCSYVFHVASPFILHSNNPDKDIIQPAIRGVKNVLQACRKSGTVKRMVLTSSVAAVFGYPADEPDGYLFSEKDWNKTSSPQHNQYYYSKTEAEKFAWVSHNYSFKMQLLLTAKTQEYVRNLPENEKFSLVSINPGMVIGPVRNLPMSTSVKLVFDVARGFFPKALPQLGFGVVDVRDVAKAHLIAATNENASGRYICTAESLFMPDMGKIIRQHYPHLPVPSLVLPNIITMAGSRIWGDRRYTIYDYRLSLSRLPRFDNSKIVTEFNFTFTSIEQSFVDTIESLIELRALPDKPRSRL